MGKSGFSEGAQFREILLVARKSPRRGDSRCVITSLKTLPRSVEEAKECAQRIKFMGQTLRPGEVYNDDTMISRIVEQEELERNLENQYVLISTYDLQVPLVLEQLIAKSALGKLTPLVSYLEKVGGHILRFDYKPPYHGTFLLAPFRAIKKVDLWVVKNIDDKFLTIENRFTKEELRVPLKVLDRGLRRPARTNKLDITEILDYIVTVKFDKVEMLLKNPSVLKEWSDYVIPRLANLLISRRFDISAPGTTLIAYYSCAPAAGVDMWNIKGVSDEDAKILAIWFNSTPSLLATFVQRTETRGAWMKLHEYALKESFILNPDALSDHDRRILLDLYEKTKEQPFPSLLQQLKTKFPLRVEIDKAVLKVLGFTDDEINGILDHLYPALAKEIEQLKTLMQG